MFTNNYAIYKVFTLLRWQHDVEQVTKMQEFHYQDVKLLSEILEFSDN